MEHYINLSLPALITLQDSLFKTVESLVDLPAMHAPSHSHDV